MGTFLVSLLLLLMVAGILRSMIRDKKRGRSCCGGNCAKCGACCKGAKPAGN